MPFGILVTISLVGVIKRWKAGKEVAFLKAGPMLSPKQTWGARADANPIEEGQANQGYDDEKEAA